MFQTFRNAWKIPELKNRLLFTLAILVVYRLGCAIPVPFVSGSALTQMFSNGNMLTYLDMMSGGALSRCTLFALGVTPYINASIIVQLLTVAIPSLENIAKEPDGQQKLQQITRYAGGIIALIMSLGYYFVVRNMGALKYTSGAAGIFTAVVIIATFTAGAQLITWCGEQIDDKGIGNGISLIIMIGIVARLPQALLAEFSARVSTSTGSLIMFVVELVILFLVFMVTIAVVQAVRKVPVQYAKRVIGNKQYGGVRQYIPLKMNAANVMPIIFAQALMFIPALFSGTAFAAAFSSMTGFWYNFTLAVLVIAFTYFYTAIIINPQMMADDMKRNGGFIPGVKPGKQTVNYIDTIMTRITLPGSFFLAIVAILPALAMKFLGIQQSFAYFYGGTSLLIMVGVVLDTLKQIESYLLMRHYDGLMKTGRIQGRH